MDYQTECNIMGEQLRQYNQNLIELTDAVKSLGDSLTDAEALRDANKIMRNINKQLIFLTDSAKGDTKPLFKIGKKIGLWG